MSDLKPCPFCGRAAHTFETRPGGSEYQVQTQCEGCGAQVVFWLPATSGAGQTVSAWADVERRWNARAEPAAA